MTYNMQQNLKYSYRIFLTRKYFKQKKKPMIKAVSKSCFKMLCTLLNDEFAKYVHDNSNCGGFHDN